MKRFSFTKLTVACAFLFAPLAASAQIETATGRSAFVDKLVLELGVGAGTSHDDVRPMELFLKWRGLLRDFFLRTRLRFYLALI